MRHLHRSKQLKIKSHKEETSNNKDKDLAIKSSTKKKDKFRNK